MLKVASSLQLLPLLVVVTALLLYIWRSPLRQQYLALQQTDGDAWHRHLRGRAITWRKLAVSDERRIDFGSQRVVEGITVFAGIVRTDKNTPAVRHTATADEASIEEILLQRRRNSDKLKKALQPMIAAIEWPPIATLPCPHFIPSAPAVAHNHRIERGQGLSHMQVWLEFTFFDNDVLDAMHRPYPEYITSNDYSSNSGIFSSESNGSLYKNGLPFLDRDVLIVLEDTARVAVKNVTAALQRVLSKHCIEEEFDLLSLGWHEPSPREDAEAAVHPQLATFAYAVTRDGARKLLHHYDVCGRSLGEQLLSFTKRGWLRHRLANISSFEPLQFNSVPPDLTNGLFRQPYRLLHGQP